ncbi:hypothetical protein B296_00043967 [Ensete ventricosum]|uniref:Uncharacterized protein n=1 Tax=Ensete ventricosum TaxID=4639 RepID=A0A426ZCQ6_ENSVE|nr:hypothetical protein B296_00043967 [Ensete ventricosum]
MSTGGEASLSMSYRSAYASLGCKAFASHPILTYVEQCLVNTRQCRAIIVLSLCLVSRHRSPSSSTSSPHKKPQKSLKLHLSDSTLPLS